MKTLKLKRRTTTEMVGCKIGTDTDSDQRCSLITVKGTAKHLPSEFLFEVSEISFVTLSSLTLAGNLEESPWSPEPLVKRFRAIGEWI